MKLTLRSTIKITLINEMDSRKNNYDNIYNNYYYYNNNEMDIKKYY